MRDGDFRVRGKDISRIEGLSDAVFGFAITLLVVSLEVPKTAGEVLHAMRGFFAFAITFSLLFMVWRTQFTYFRRYGLEDNVTVGLTAVLLFTVLFFVYPLKFIFSTVVNSALIRAGFPDPTAVHHVQPSDLETLFVAYGLGWSAVFGVFAFLYLHGYKLRDQLQLSPVEEFDTIESIWGAAGAVAGGLLIAVMNGVELLLPGRDDVIAYVFPVPIIVILGFSVRRRRTRKQRRAAVFAQLSHSTES
ncbi:MAG TPA: TMEM175 family protein [Gemmatimonadaceae bacterium]